MGKNQYVTKHPLGGWQVKGEGNSKATVHTETQKEAISKAREIAINQKSDLVICGENGKIREKTPMEKTHFLRAARRDKQDDVWYTLYCTFV